MYSTLSVFGFLLLLLPTAAAYHTYHEKVIPESMMKLFPQLKVTDASCKPTKWLDTYKNASYVGMIRVITSKLLTDGNWVNIYEEAVRFKGSKPQHLFTTYSSLIRFEQYMITSSEDGDVSNCMGFAEKDGGVPTRARRLDYIPRELLDRLYEWAKTNKKSDLVQPKC